MHRHRGYRGWARAEHAGMFAPAAQRCSAPACPLRYTPGLRTRRTGADSLCRAYRKKALSLHPDKGGDPEAFKEVTGAYEALSDPQKRDM